MNIYTYISSPQRQSTFAKVVSKTPAFVLGVILFAPAFAMGDELKTNQRSETTAAVSSSGFTGIKPQPSSTAQQKQQASTDSTPRESDSSNSPDDYKNSLKQLSSLYELDAKRLTQDNGQLKELYAEGLVARMELDASDKSVAEAQAKVEAVRKQIAEA